MTATHLTLVTTCKGRLHHLRRSLPTFLGQEFPAEEGDVAYRVVVVDYGCPDGAYDWCREHVDDPRLEVVRVEDGVEWFNLSRARNIGARVALAGSGETGLLAFIDVDLELPPDSLARGLAAIRAEGLLRLNHSRRQHDDGRPCFNGQVILAARAFRELRGYDEAMSHWGGDDIDLYNRSKRMGHASGTWDSGLRVIHHEEEDRLRFIPVGDREESLEHNHRVVRDRAGDHVNPDGYGISNDYRLLRGEDIGLEHPPVDEPRGCVCDASGWCQRHQCTKTGHWHVLCRTHSDYRRLWDEGRGPGQRSGRTPRGTDIRGPEPRRRFALPFPDEAYEAVFAPLRGRRMAFARMPGNVGDALIRRATFDLCRRFEVDCFEAAPTTDVRSDGWFIAAGGNMGGRHRRCQAIRKRVLAKGLPVTVLPQSFTTVEHLPYARVFVRERESLAFRPDAQLAPDPALAFVVGDDVPPEHGEGRWLRRDGEALFREVPAEGDPARACRTPDDYLALASRYEHVVTDRLHFAIAALLCGREVTLLPNDYHKNRSMYDTWLVDLGCRWREEP